ncbi:MAG: PIN domain protein [Planctomycetota bacterium]
MKQLRVYIDTSVVGGCLDMEYSQWSQGLFELARRGEVVLIASALLQKELLLAPKDVQSILAAVNVENVERVDITAEAEALRDAYLAGGIVGPASTSDALHVAIATVSHADVIVSWNFRHIVHFEKIRGFNAVNIREGYGAIEIRTPRELIP